MSTAIPTLSTDISATHKSPTSEGGKGMTREGVKGWERVWHGRKITTMKSINGCGYKKKDNSRKYVI